MKTLAATYVDARNHSPVSSSFAVSQPKLENVVKPPKNPTAMAILRSGEINNLFSVIWPISPRKKQPAKLMNSVPKGNAPPHFSSVNSWIPYRASVPIAPNTAIKNIFTHAPRFGSYRSNEYKTKNSWRLAATRSHQPHTDRVQDAACGGFGELHRPFEF